MPDIGQLFSRMNMGGRMNMGAGNIPYPTSPFPTIPWGAGGGGAPPTGAPTGGPPPGWGTGPVGPYPGSGGGSGGGGFSDPSVMRTSSIDPSVLPLLNNITGWTQNQLEQYGPSTPGWGGPWGAPQNQLQNMGVNMFQNMMGQQSMMDPASYQSAMSRAFGGDPIYSPWAQQQGNMFGTVNPSTASPPGSPVSAVPFSNQMNYMSGTAPDPSAAGRPVSGVPTIGGSTGQPPLPPGGGGMEPVGLDRPGPMPGQGAPNDLNARLAAYDTLNPTDQLFNQLFSGAGNSQTDQFGSQLMDQIRQQATNPGRYDQTAMSAAGDQAFQSDLDEIMAKTREEFSGMGLGAGSSDRNTGLVRAGSDAANRYRLGKEQLNMQGFNDAESRRLSALGLGRDVSSIMGMDTDQAIQALPAALQRYDSPFQRMFAIEENAANRRSQALPYMMQAENQPYDRAMQAYGLGEAQRETQDQILGRQIEDFYRNQFGMLDRAQNMVYGTPQMNIGYGPSQLSQWGNFGLGAANILSQSGLLNGLFGGGGGGGGGGQTYIPQTRGGFGGTSYGPGSWDSFGRIPGRGPLG